MPRGVGYVKNKTPAKKRASSVKIAPMAKDEAKWRAEDDARTLMRAEEIKRDSARIKAAQAQAKKQMEELARLVKK